MLENSSLLIFISVFISLLILISFYLYIKSKYILPILKLAQKINLNKTVLNTDQALKIIINRVELLEKETENATIIAEKIGDGNLEIDINTENSQNNLLRVLNNMRNKLKKIALDDYKRNWSIEGIAIFDKILRDNYNSEISITSKLFLTKLVKYLNANQGGIFIINNENKNDIHISLCCDYAFDSEKKHNVRIELNEGLLGQAIKDKEVLLVTDVSEMHFKINSGLGEASPACIIIVPALVNTEVIGAFEISSFKVFEDFEIDFIKKVTSSFAAIYKSITSNYEMTNLLLESQNITENLKNKEEVLIQNEIELQNAQDNLNQKLIELMAETNLTNSILSAINKSNASIQFDSNGNILDVNEMFLSVMKYDKNELIGRNEKIFIPKEELESERYTMMWKSLKEGNFNSGEFKRLTKFNNEVWMDVTYNPIIDLSGKVFKILMFANFTTDQKLKENEYLNKISAFTETFGFLELNTNFSIKSANNLFLENFKIKRKDLKNITFLDLLDEEDNISNLKEIIEMNLQNSLIFNQNISIKNSNNKSIKINTIISNKKNVIENNLTYYVILNFNNLTI